MTTHRITPERRTLHGHWSRDLAPVLTVDPGDSVVYRTLDAGWTLERPARREWPLWFNRRRFSPMDAVLDNGHALCGPVAVRGAEPGMALAVRFDVIRPADWGWTLAGGWETPTNRAQNVLDERAMLFWDIDADAGTATAEGFTVRTRPFMGVAGVAPAEPGVHSTTPPRAVGGNIDCKELVAGSKLYLPVAVSGALFSVGDGHAAQGDGEVGGMAIECAMDEVAVTFDLVSDLVLTAPRAETPTGRVTFGFSSDLNEATQTALRNMVDWMMALYGITRSGALALASVAVDLRVTQIVNEVWGVHAVLPHDAIRH